MRAHHCLLCQGRAKSPGQGAPLAPPEPSAFSPHYRIRPYCARTNIGLVYIRVMDGPGTITWEEFLEDAKRLLVVSDRISDGWEFRGDKDIPGQAYLFRRIKCFVPMSDSVIMRNDDDDEEEEFHVKFQEDPHEAPRFDPLETPFITEHHILWSMSYGVPILFFNGWRSDFPGINAMSVNEAQTVHDSKLNYMELSQAIHPILGTPFLQLHPCLSQELLQSMSKSKNKLVSWLSCVAPAALNLKIHPEYYKLTYKV